MEPKRCNHPYPMIHPLQDMKGYIVYWCGTCCARFSYDPSTEEGKRLQDLNKKGVPS